MGKRGQTVGSPNGKVKSKVRLLEKPFADLAAELPIRTLLRIGRVISSTDYVVKYYSNKSQPKFYRNKPLLIRTVRRAFRSTSNADRERVLDILESEGVLKIEYNT